MAALGSYVSVELFQITVTLKSTPKEYVFLVYRGTAYTDVQPKDQKSISYLVFDWENAKLSNPIGLPLKQSYPIIDKDLRTHVLACLNSKIHEVIAQWSSIPEEPTEIPSFTPRQRTIAKQAAKTGSGGLINYLTKNLP